MDKKKLENIAKKVIEKSNLPVENYGSVILVLMFISIIITSVRVIQECNKNKIRLLSGNAKKAFFAEQIKEISVKRGWYTKMRLKKIIRNELKPEDYRDYKNSTVSAILDVAEELKEDEISTLMEAVNV